MNNAQSSTVRAMGPITVGISISSRLVVLSRYHVFPLPIATRRGFETYDTAKRRRDENGPTSDRLPAGTQPMATNTSSPPEEPPGVAVKSTGCGFDPKCCVTDSGRNIHWVTLPLQAEEHPRIAGLAQSGNSRLDFKRQAIPAVE
jgi:hypothetical protein